MSFIYVPNFRPSRGIVLYGCGGTGSRIVAPLVQFLKQASQEFNPTGIFLRSVPVILVDGDVVEEKNLARQHFVAADVGKNKAACLAQRYTKAFNYPYIFHLPKFINRTTPIIRDLVEPSGRDLYAGLVAGGGPDMDSLAGMIHILAVDSGKARRDILSSIHRWTRSGHIDRPTAQGKCLIIDAGNEDNFGQVSMFNNLLFISAEVTETEGRKGLPERLPVRLQTNAIPMPIVDYLVRGSTAQQLSCADLPQTLAVNNNAAALVMSMVQSACFMKPTAVYETSFHLTDGWSSRTLSLGEVDRRRICVKNGGYGPSGKRGLSSEIEGLSSEQIIFYQTLFEVRDHNFDWVRSLTNSVTVSPLNPEANSSKTTPQADNLRWLRWTGEDPNGNGLCLSQAVVKINRAKYEQMKIRLNADGTIYKAPPPVPVPAPPPAVAPALKPVEALPGGEEKENNQPSSSAEGSESPEPPRVVRRRRPVTANPFAEVSITAEAVTPPTTVATAVGTPAQRPPLRPAD
jgi:hypothetical protein